VWKAKRAFAAVVFGCSAVLFAAGLAVAVWAVATTGSALWRQHQQQRAAHRQAEAACAGRHRADQSGTPAEQYESCVADHPYTDMRNVAPAVGVFLAGPALLYLGITGLVAYLSWDYLRDRQRRRAASSGDPERR
jgi:hypothetical protein